MKKENKFIAGTLYICSMLLILWGAFFQLELSVSKIAIGSTLLIAPWIMCIVSASKKKDNGILWIVFLVGCGGIAIPLYLLTVNEREKIVLDTK